MIIVTTVEHDLWGDPHISVLGFIDEETYKKYKEWVNEDFLKRKNFSLDFTDTNSLKDISDDFKDKMQN